MSFLTAMRALFAPKATAPVTAELLSAVGGRAINADLITAYNEAATRFNINTPRQLAMWLANVAHESSGFTRREEDMNYSAESIMRTFGHKTHSAAVSNEEARKLAKNPSLLAERVYGPEKSPRLARTLGNVRVGDGALFIGHGDMQHTGRAAHQALVEAFPEAGLADALQAIPWLKTVRGGALGAGWFWANRQLGPLAESGNSEAVRKKINGGLTGYSDVQRRYLAGCAALGIKP